MYSPERFAAQNLRLRTYTNKRGRRLEGHTPRDAQIGGPRLGDLKTLENSTGSIPSATASGIGTNRLRIGMVIKGKPKPIMPLISAGPDETTICKFAI